LKLWKLFAEGISEANACWEEGTSALQFLLRHPEGTRSLASERETSRLSPTPRRAQRELERRHRPRHCACPRLAISLRIQPS
jgi:hypothetical protein